MEIATGSASGLVVEAAKCGFVFVKRQVCYFFNHESKVKILTDQLEKLTDARDRLQHSNDEATRNAEEIEQDVQKCLTKINKKITEDMEELRKDEDKAKKKCFLGLCPAFMSRYQLSKKAEAAADAIAILLTEADKFISYKVSYQPNPQKMLETSVKGFEAFQSREVVLEGIMEALNDPIIQRIGVYGMGGVGKTMLVKEVATKAKVNLFDEVVIATISNSQKTDTKGIQGELADRLGLKFEEESEPGRANRLRQRLNKEGSRILVILDDLWAKVDLDAVGIVFNDDQDNKKVRRKMLFTSRSEDILSNQMSTEKNFFVAPLSSGEAMALFTKIVGYKVEQPDYMSIAKELVKRCGGLPVAISVIANALKNMDDLKIWKDALRQIKRSNPSNIEGMQDSVYSAIEFSYSYLKSKEAQEIFLLCSMWPQGSDISVLDLTKYCWGLDLLNDVTTLNEARESLNSFVRKLKASGLLLGSDTDELVKVHDIVRDVAISIASRDEKMFVVDDEIRLDQLLRKGKLKHSTKLSLPFCDIHELFDVLHSPQLQLLLVHSKSRVLKIPNSFFKETDKLKVLHLTGMNFPSMTSSFLFLINLRTLCLHQCSLGDIAVIGELKALEVLSFVKSDIEQLPAELRKLSNLKLLNLTGCFRLKLIPRSLISSLCGLEELLMGNSFDQWGVEDNISLMELKHLSHLIALEICIPDALMMPKNLFSETLERYKIHIGDVWNERYFNDKTSAALKLKLNTNLYLDHGIQMLLKKSEDLFLDEVKGVKNVMSKLGGTGISQLKNLYIENCSELQHVMDSSQGVSYAVFPNLESLSLLRLINLENIYEGQLKAGSFSKLRVIKVYSCRKMRHLLSYSMARELCQIQEIEVSECENIIKIVESKEEDTNDKLDFGSLRILKVTDIPKLLTFCCERARNSKSLHEYIGGKIELSLESNQLFNDKDALPCLEKLELSSINIHSIWDNTASFPSPNLTTLIIDCCSNLRNLFSSSNARSLQQLKRLELSECRSITEIVATDYEMAHDEISFPHLELLSFVELPKLTRFCGSPIKLSLLRELYIRDCPVLASFVNNKVTGETSNHGQAEKKEPNENLHSKMPPLFDERVELPKLEILEISRIESLKRIWGEQLALGSFNNLNDFSVGVCNGLLNIFPITMLRRLQRLSKLSIYRCNSVEEIFECEEPNLNHGEQPAAKLELSSVTYICFNELPKLKRFFGKTIECPSLRRMTLLSCSRVELLFASDYLSFQKAPEEEKSQPPLFWVNEVTFSNLEELTLQENKNLKEIWCAQGQCSSQYFPNLKVLNHDFSGMDHHIRRGPLLNCFWSFPSLKTLEIINNPFKEIFQGELLVGETKLDLPNTQLSELKLTCLNELRCLWNDKLEPFEPLFQELTALKVYSCKKLKNLVPSSKSFPNLVTLNISYCNGLINLLTLSVAKSFLHLTRMRVAYCERIEGIIAEDEAKDVVVFTQLKNLELNNLPSLQNFCSSTAPIQFPTLDELIMKNCPQLKTFCQGALSAPKLQKVQLIKAKDEERYRVLDNDLNNTIKQLYKEKVGLIGLWNLDFSKFSELVEVWNCSFPQKVLEFQNLIGMKLCNCKSNSLKFLLTPSMVLCLVNLEFMEIENCNIIEQVMANVDAKELKTYKIILPRLDSISLASCSNLISFFVGSYALECPILQWLDIVDCPKMVSFSKEQVDEDISESYKLGEGMTEAFFSNKVIFPSLEHLRLSSMNIEKIWHDELSSVSYYADKLSALSVKSCHNLKYVMSSSMVKNFLKLYKLQICHCKIMEAIVVTNEGLAEEERMAKLLFPTLSYLELEGLPELTSFCSISGSVLFNPKASFPGLKVLKLSLLKNVKSIWDNQIPTCSFGELKTLEINHCERLLSIFPSNTLATFQGVERITIEDCHSLEALVEVQGININGIHAMKDTKLKELHLIHLPKMKHVWDKDFQGILSLENLRLVHALRCWNLKNLFPISVAKAGLAQLEEVDISFCGVEELFGNGRGQEEVARFEFPQLTKVKLWELPRFKSLYPGGKGTIFCSKLETLEVFHCSKLKIFDTNQLYNVQGKNVKDQQDLHYQQKPLFSIEEVGQKLKVLSLNSVDIAMIKTQQFPISELFHEITTFHLLCYHDGLVAFPFCFLERFLNLEKLVVRCCKFKQLFPCGGDTNEENYVGTVLSRIRHLQLNMLGDLRHVQNHNTERNSPIHENLGTLEVWYCDTTFPTLAPFIASFPNLANLDVWNCNGMENILATSTCQGLVQLRIMRMRECYTVTEIVAKEAGDEGTCDITFSKLEHLELDCLPSLTSFYSGNYTLNFPYLEKVIVNRCPGLNLFSHGVLSTPELERVSEKAEGDKGYEEDKVHWTGDLNSTIQQFYTKKVGYRGLKYIDFSQFPELADIWINTDLQETLDFKNLESLEVCNYNSLTYLFTPSMALGLVKLCSLKVKNCTSIEHVITEEGLDGSALVKDVMLLPLLESVSLESCPNLTSFYLLGRDALECLSLKKITVIDCPNMITFASSLFRERKKDTIYEASKERPFSGKEVDSVCIKSFFTDTVELPSLGHLRLSSVNIPKIWEDSKLSSMSSCVQHLTVLIVESWGNSKYLFASPMIKSCAQLETLEIRDSKLMTAVALDDIQRSENHSEPSSSENHFEFPCMRELLIENCPSLETFITNTLNGADETFTSTLALLDEKVSFPSLERLKLQSIGGKVVWHGQHPLAKTLVQLRITDCGMIREVMACAPNEVTRDGIVFNQLKYLELGCLPKLESFCSAECTFGFPSLIEVIVQDCPNMKTFSGGKISTPKLKRLQMTKSKDEELCEGNLNTTIQNFFANKSKET